MLVAEHITKKFPGVIALQDVGMELHPGKVNAILGENGAGKSTLMKIFSGVYPTYEGRILLNGKTVNFANTHDALAAGIGIIHQELSLIPHLSVTENIFLGRELTNSFGLLDQKAMKIRAKQLLEKLKLNISPDTSVEELKVGQQQVVEIAKALLTDCQVLIMDEPTSAITESEIIALFAIIEKLKNEGKIIVYISHKLDELFKIADRYIVLRDGKTIESGEMSTIDQDTLIKKMVGRDINIIRRKNQKSAVTPLLEVNSLYLKHPINPKRNLLKDLSFQLFPGEIVGIFGLMGAGRTELLETIFGLHKNRMIGSLLVNRKSADFKSPGEALKAGIALVPEDRKKDGLVLDLSVKSNISLTSLNDLHRFGLLSSKKERHLSDQYVSSLKIKTNSIHQLARNLSGGNQQKIVLAKCLATKPLVLMLDEPTRGIDINAKNEIYKLIMEFAANGMSILMVSSELPEILAISDRIIVMADGAITAEFSAEEASENNILKAALPKNLV
jgi:ribose transport system ATP-binding protein